MVCQTHRTSSEDGQLVIEEESGEAQKRQRSLGHAAASDVHVASRPEAENNIDAQNIERILHGTAESLPESGVLVVDDGSPDGTGDLVKSVTAELPDVHLMAIMEVGGADPGRVHAISTADLDPARPTRRLANSVLDNMALRA